MKAKITISGKVQAVGYRYWVYGEMRELGLAGRAANQDDGTVLLEVESAKEAINELARRCHVGPPLAEVSGVRIQWSR